MTIASEITRLQNDKAAMCAAIENKGVTVGNVTLDDYASCIDAISSGGGGGCIVDYLVVGAGGGGFGGCGVRYYGGGGGAGQAILGSVALTCNITDIKIGIGGYGQTYDCSSDNINGGDTCFGSIVACGGGGGGGQRRYESCKDGKNGGSGGGGQGSCYNGQQGCGGTGILGDGITPRGNNGAAGLYSTNAGTTYAGGGGGAGTPASSCTGGMGIISNIEGELKCYSGGGGGGACVAGCGSHGGGNGSRGGYGGNGSTCGSGGGGAGNTCSRGGCGGGGLVVVRYKTDGSCGFTQAFGGCKYICGDYTIHCFPLDDKFIICDNASRCIGYMVVGGGGAGKGSGGGGGAVKMGLIPIDTTSFSIVIGCGGTTPAANGTASCLGNLIIANGGCGGGTTPWGGTSGSGYWGGRTATNCCSAWAKGGGGGASSMGGNGSGEYCGGVGGYGICGYGGGGGGANYCDTYSLGYDGGGCGVCCVKACANATNCGGGGGGARCCNNAGNGANGVVDICYACDGSYGFTTATGGDSCYLCGDICVHRFTSDGTFTIVS